MDPFVPRQRANLIPQLLVLILIPIKLLLMLLRNLVRISDLLQIPTFGIAPTISRPFVTLVKLRGMATLGN